MTGCKFSARNYRNLDPIKSKSKASFDQNVNILPDVKLLKNAANNQQVGSLVGSKLLTSVKDLRKSIKNLMAIYDEKGSTVDTKAKNPECLGSQEKARPRPRKANVAKSNRQNLDCRRLTTNKPASLNDHKYLDLKAKCNSPRISNKSAQLFNAKQNNIVRLLDQNLNDDLLLKMGIRHTSKFGDSSMRNSKSVYDYGCSEEVKQCSLLKYSISFPISIESEARQQPEYEVNQARKTNKTKTKIFKKKPDQSSSIETNRYSVQSEFQPSPNKPIYNTRSISFDFSNKDLDSLVIAKALVVQDFTPSPYDTDSLCLRDGDVIDVIDMNETGIWTGILNKKFGKFKFIYVKIIESKNRNLKTSLEPSASSLIESCVPGSLTINNLRSYKSSAAYGLNLETKKINTSSNYNQKKFKSLSYGYLNSICYKLNENKRGATNRSGSVPVYTCLDKQSINFSQIYSTSVTKPDQTFGHTQTDNHNDDSCTWTRQACANRCKSLKDKVNYRKRRAEMGQKQFRSSNDLFNELIGSSGDKSSISITKKKKTASVSSDSSTSSSKSKSNHDSHLSNDSGCYSNTDRYSSPSDSSVLADFKSRTLTKRQSQKCRNSVCDSVILSCSSSDSSINVEPSDDSNKKAQLLCDQLNQILNLSTNNHKPVVVDSDQSLTAQVTRSHTLNANDKSQPIVIRRDLEHDGAKKSKISNLVKSSRKFFAHSTTQKSGHLAQSKQSSKLNKKLCDLIAARLASESIDLASGPFTDQMGFCKVPMALVKRYASELGHNFQLVAKCIEAERLAQVEKNGKLGIPNDFMYKECKCKNLISSDLIKWKLCKCDIDSSSLDSFLFSLGLSMYIEKFKQRNVVKSLQDLKRLMDLNDHKQFEIAASIIQSNSQTKSHFKILSNSIVFCEF